MPTPEREWRQVWRQAIINNLEQLTTLVNSDLWIDMVTSGEAGDIAALLEMAVEVATAKAILEKEMR
jgi:hypothetical protein